MLRTIYNSRNYIEAIAHLLRCHDILIYNSRNYIEAIAIEKTISDCHISTIVEIILRLLPEVWRLVISSIYNSRNYIEAIARVRPMRSSVVIYNSRNYIEAIASVSRRLRNPASTIVEIILRLLPDETRHRKSFYLQ